MYDYIYRVERNYANIDSSTTPFSYKPTCRGVPLRLRHQMTCLLLPRPPYDTEVTVSVTTRTIFSDASKKKSCPKEIPCARPKRRKTGVATACSCSVCEMFDLGTSQRPVPLKTSERFCRKAPRSYKQFSASNTSPGSSRRHGLSFRRMCFTLVSGMPGAFAISSQLMADT